MIKKTPDPKVQDVLHAFSIEPNQNTETLALYLDHYPQFREAIIDLSIELLTAPKLDEHPPIKTNSDNAEQAWTIFQTLLSPTDPVLNSSKTISNPLSHLDSMHFREIAEKLNITRLLLGRIRDNAINPSTIPSEFLSKIAQLLDVSVDTFYSALHGSQKIAPSQRFKSDQKPTAGKQISFTEAIENSNLTEDQKSIIKSMMR